MFAHALVLAAALLLVAPGPGKVWAGAPTDQLRSQINRTIQILDDPELKKPGKSKDRRAAVRQVANDIFDFGETAKRSLARHWAARSQAERDEFVQLFADLLAPHVDAVVPIAFLLRLTPLFRAVGVAALADGEDGVLLA